MLPTHVQAVVAAPCESRFTGRCLTNRRRRPDAAGSRRQQPTLPLAGHTGNSNCRSLLENLTSLPDAAMTRARRRGGRAVLSGLLLVCTHACSRSGHRESVEQPIGERGQPTTGDQGSPRGNGTGTIAVRFADSLAPHRWQLVLAAKPESVAVERAGSERSVSVSPGEYRIQTQMRQYGDWQSWPDAVRVEKGDSSTVDIVSRFEIRFPGELEPYRWQLARAADPSVTFLDRAGADRSTLVPAGEYRVQTQMRQYGDWQGWPNVIQVPVNGSVVTDISSRFEIRFPSGMEPYRWQLVRAADPSVTFLDRAGADRSTLVPAGEYRVQTQMRQYGDWQGWPTAIQVPMNGAGSADIESRFEIRFPSGFVPYRWQLVRASDPSTAFLNRAGDDRSTLAPPGDYRVHTQMRQYGDWQGWPNAIQVPLNGSVTVDIASRLEVQFPAGLEPYSWRVVGNNTDFDLARSGADRVTLVPPGTYRIETQMKQYGEWVRAPREVRVEPGLLTRFQLNRPPPQR